jgi:hypothetical protein
LSFEIQFQETKYSWNYYVLVIIVTLPVLGYSTVPWSHLLPGTALESFLHTSIIIPVGLKYVRNMAESREETLETGISPVVTEYNKWEEHGKKLAIEQARQVRREIRKILRREKV